MYTREHTDGEVTQSVSDPGVCVRIHTYVCVFIYVCLCVYICA